MMLAEKVDKIIQSIDSLRPMPANVTRILKEMGNAEIGIRTLADFISLDQALTSLVLQLSNSVSLGYPRTCSTLYEAIMQIGLGRLRTVLMASPGTNMLSRRLRGYRLGEGELWNHSLATAVVSEWLGQALRYPKIEEAYICGLLHDIGKLFLDQFVLDDYPKIVDYVQRYQMQLWQVEEKLIGIDHARVGGLIAERWNFPAPLVDAIRFHHAPSFARTNQHLPAIVNIANSFAADIKMSNPDLFSNFIHPESLNILKIDDARVGKLRAALETSGLFPDYSSLEKSQ